MTKFFGLSLHCVYGPDPFHANWSGYPFPDPSNRIWKSNNLKGLILAQNERWRRGLGMQVEGDWGQLQSTGVRGSNAWVTNPPDGDSYGKL